MKDTPWGVLPVSDAHVHFFSHRFFQTLAEQKQTTAQELGPMLGWQISSEDTSSLADAWTQELDRHGVERSVLIASVPGDHESVIAAVRHAPRRFYGYIMVNPAAPDASASVQDALA